jgi:ribosomal-protein-alanine acetyltransferase
VSFRQTIKEKLFRLLGKEPEAVVVTFLTGDTGLGKMMAAQVRQLIPDRRHIRVGLQGAEADIILKGHTTLALYGELKARLGKYRIGLAPVLFAGGRGFTPLRRAAFLLAPRKILAYNTRLERHHLRLWTLFSSTLFLRGVPLDRIRLRPWWLIPWKRDRSRYPKTVQTIEGRPTSPRRRRIAILTTDLPWPLTDGAAIRTYNLLREASQDFDVFLFTFRDGKPPDPGPLHELCARLFLVDKPHYREPRWSSLLPPTVKEFDSPAMRRLWREECRNNHIGLRQVEHAALARYGGQILVEHGVTFDLHSQLQARQRSLSSWWNLFRWRRFESRVARRFDKVIVTSTKDAALLPQARTVVIPNGVDLEHFQPQIETPGFNLLFVGAFRHPSNVMAYRYFTEKVWPTIYAQLPDATFDVVAGPDHLRYWREHTGSIAIPEDPWIEVHGAVSDVRPLYTACNLVIVPTTVFTGTNVSVLEAMAMERAIVSTPSGCAGLGLQHGENIWIGATEMSFAEGVVTLLRDQARRARLACAARRYAIDNFDWRTIATQQRAVYDELLPPAIAIRPATTADLPSLARIQASCAEASHWPPDRYLAYTCRVAVVDSKIAGFLVSRQTVPGEREILNLAVSPEYRRSGIATALLRAEINAAPGEFFLEVRESNTTARLLYEHLGFQAAGMRLNYYDDPVEHAVVMRLKS